MPSSVAASSTIAFVPARSIPSAPAPESGIAFVPAAGRAPDLRALDRFEGVPSPSTSMSASMAASAEQLIAAPARRDRPVLLYNDQCEVCRVLSAWVKKSDAAGSDLIDERPIGDDPAALQALDPKLDIWEVYKEIHLLMPDGTVKRGGEAIGEVLKRLPKLDAVTWLLDVGVGDFKPFQGALNVAYKVLDALRPAIGCKSCGGGPVAWWALPVKWTADLVRALRA